MLQSSLSQIFNNATVLSAEDSLEFYLSKFIAHC